VIDVSYFYHFCDHPDSQLDQLARAALLVDGAVKFRDSIAQGTLMPDRLGKQGPWLCSVGYKYMFNACRIPQANADIVRLFDPAYHNHIVVVRKGLFFRLELMVCDMLQGGQKRYMTPREIAQSLKEIVRFADANDQSTVAGIGVLSSDSRRRWASLRSHLVRTISITATQPLAQTGR
jgi:carnitine O-acetyltransferase